MHHQVRVEDQAIVGGRFFAHAGADLLELAARALDRLAQPFDLVIGLVVGDAQVPRVVPVRVDDDGEADPDARGRSDTAQRERLRAMSEPFPETILDQRADRVHGLLGIVAVGDDRDVEPGWPHSSSSSITLVERALWPSFSICMSARKLAASLASTLAARACSPSSFTMR